MKPQLSWLDDPQVFRVGQIPAHSDHRFYRSEEEYREGRSSFSQSLNGIWQFFWSPNAGERPVDFYKPDADVSAFGTIPVPAHMEMQGYDRIHYINTMYPWEGHLYRRPAYGLPGSGAQSGQFSEAEYNPVGSYRCRFDLDEGLKGSRVCISFEGVEQAMYVWLNGEFAGYAEDSFTPSEFDLTPWIKEKDNLLAVEVHKRSTAAYLEDQDFFRFSGIFRNVILYAKPEVHVEDLWARPVLNEDHETGKFSLELALSGQGRCRAEYLLKDADGTVMLKETVEAEAEIFFQQNSFSRNIKFAAAQISGIHSWSCEDPYLYRLEIRIFGQDGRLLELVPYDIGFCRVSLEDGVMKVNGKRLVILGVNRHEWNARTGRVITEADMRWDMECFHANHINSVRTCHYPNQIPWYYLCDAEGVYMMAEVNLESHGSWQKMGAVEPSWNVPGSSPQWREAVLDRARTNFELFKNHVSVIFWSLGNESYAGENLKAMQQWLEAQQDGRLIHYEGVFHNRDYEDSISHMESQMYAPPERVQEYLEQSGKKPFILCEYMHDMGNSLGGLGSYMALLDQYENYQGGYIWDFIDQALLVKDEVTGREVLRYGGDFDDRPSDYEFSGNGIVFADRTEKPAIQEVKYYYGKYK
mgnify:CR=1 FL=1